MGQVLIRNLEDEVLDACREAAVRNGRSLEVELRDFLRRLKPLTQLESEAWLSRVAAIRALTPDVPQTPSEVLVREERDGFRDS